MDSLICRLSGYFLQEVRSVRREGESSIVAVQRSTKLDAGYPHRGENCPEVWTQKVRAVAQSKAPRRGYVYEYGSIGEEANHPVANVAEGSVRPHDVVYPGLQCGWYRQVMRRCGEHDGFAFYDLIDKFVGKKARPKRLLDKKMRARRHRKLAINMRHVRVVQASNGNLDFAI